MTKTYQNGEEFLAENRSFLDTNCYLAAFFFLDAPLLKTINSQNYAYRYEEGERVLLLLKTEPYDPLFFGDATCVPFLLDEIRKDGKVLESALCTTEIGEAIAAYMSKRGISFVEELAMDFMEAKEVTEPSSLDVLVATEEDTEEICFCSRRFIVDCGLHDKVDPENVRKTIRQYRLQKKDGKIVAMAKMIPSSSGNDARIVAVYTRDDYRGKGYARQVVNTLKNEILESGRVATLNVDKKNPVSNHLYASLGFKKLFSQGVFRKTDDHRSSMDEN